MTTLSLCMIVKDEEATLDRILNCAKDFTDEIIIVDTGSDDETVNIAKRYTDKVYFFKWTNDFSEARNYSLKKATKDYIMWLDADDFIDEENILKIKNMLITDLYADIYMLKYKIVSPFGAECNLEFYRERLLKRSGNFLFEGAVHEAVNLSGKVVYSNIVIEHRKVKPPLFERNLNIYRLLESKNKIFTPRDLYYYGRELYYNGYYQKAKEKFHLFLNSNGSDTDKEEGYILLSDCYLKEGNLPQAKETIFSSLKKYPPSPETFCKTGEIFFSEGNYGCASAYYRAAETSEEKSYGFIRKEYGGIVPCLMLTVIYFRLERYDLAKEYHKKCKKLCPNHPSVLFNDKIPLLAN